MTEDLEISVEFSFERMEHCDVEQKEKSEENHGEDLNKRRHQEHQDNEHQTMEHEERVEQSVLESLLPVHWFVEQIELSVLPPQVEHASRLHDHAQSQERKNQVHESEQNCKESWGWALIALEIHLEWVREGLTFVRLRREQSPI